MGQTARAASTDWGAPMTPHIQGFTDIAVGEVNDA